MDKYTSTLLPQDNTKEENQKATLDLLAKINTLVDDINSQIDATKQALIPVGFVYTQWPGMGDPDTLWPFGTWTNISSTFSGSFPRVEGGNASAFESGQQLDAFQGFQVGSVADSTGARNYWGATDERDTQGQVQANVNYASIKFRTTAQGVANRAMPVNDGTNGAPRMATETRPVNYTVRIWRRTA